MPTKIELDENDSAVIIKSNGQLKSIIPQDGLVATSYIATIVVFMLQDSIMFKKIEKAFLKKAKKSNQIPIQMNRKNEKHHTIEK